MKPAFLQNRKADSVPEVLEYLEQGRDMYICMTVFDAWNIAFFCSDFGGKLFLSHAGFQAFGFQPFAQDKDLVTATELLTDGSSRRAEVFGYQIFDRGASPRFQLFFIRSLLLDLFSLIYKCKDAYWAKITD